ncbi:MAG TPA: YeiH family protein [Verrucomicrobiae bacterium]|nr:YeiH family protein [Verrucomicrobiae bacterium]
MSESDNNYAWAEFLGSMEGVDVDLPVMTRPRAVASAVPRKYPDQPLWGIAMAIAITFAAGWLAELDVWPFTTKTGSGRAMHPVEPVMIAIILGMVIGNAWKLPKALLPGLKLSVKKFLPLGIVLLGARLNFGDMMKVGLTGLALSGLETVVALALLFFLGRWLNLPWKLATLLGVGTAICGGTAIVATAPVIDAEEKDVAFSVATVTLLGLLGMFALPVLGHYLDLTSRQFGIWAGLAIHQTPQVIAAGYSYWPTGADYTPEAGDTATIVKLARVCLLAPVVFVLGLIHARSKVRESGETARKTNYLRLFPMFILGFVGMALLKTLGLLPDITVHDATFVGAGTHTANVGAVAEKVSRFCIVVSMAAVGLETKFAAMRRTGMKPLVASFVAVLIVAVLVLVLIKALGI